MVEVFKTINGIALSIKDDFYLFRENTQNIWNFQIISKETIKTVRYGLKTVKDGTPLIWANLPEEYILQNV